MRTIAFIPVGGGIKSIPLKNIKDFCGKPLMYWNIVALQNCNKVDETTDSEEIKETVVQSGFNKVKTYNRSAKTLQIRQVPKVLCW